MVTLLTFCNLLHLALLPMYRIFGGICLIIVAAVLISASRTEIGRKLDRLHFHIMAAIKAHLIAIGKRFGQFFGTQRQLAHLAAIIPDPVGQWWNATIKQMLFPTEPEQIRPNFVPEPAAAAEDLPAPQHLPFLEARSKSSSPLIQTVWKNWWPKFSILPNHLD